MDKRERAKQRELEDKLFEQIAKDFYKDLKEEELLPTPQNFAAAGDK